MMKKIVNLLFPVIFVFCSISPSLSQNWGGNRASSVVVETLIRENLATTKEISAKVVSSISYTVSASSNGFVLMENIKVGDRIKKNQLIAIQDTSEFEYNLKIKQNQLTDAQLILEDLKNELNEEKNIKEIIQKQLNLLKSKYDRAKDLYESNAISAQELETSTTSYLTSQQQEFLKVKTIKKLNFKIKQAENNIEKLDIEINELKKDIKGSRLVSPIDGHLTDVFKIKNGYVRTGESLATIQGGEDFEIEVEVPTNYLKFIQEKKSINGLDVNGKNFKALYRAILLNENPRTGTRTVRLSFKDKIEKEFSNVNCFLSGQNLGYAKGNNFGLSKVKSDYALILNPDAFLEKSTLDRLLFTANKFKDFSIIGCLPFLISIETLSIILGRT